MRSANSRVTFTTSCLVPAGRSERGLGAALANCHPAPGHYPRSFGLHIAGVPPGRTERVRLRRAPTPGCRRRSVPRHINRLRPRITPDHARRHSRVASLERPPDQRTRRIMVLSEPVCAAGQAVCWPGPRSREHTGRLGERGELVAEDVSTSSPARPARAGWIRVLLIDDDDGDALLVNELLLDAGEPFGMSRARSMAEARAVLTDETCVLLDLELPDSRGLEGVQRLQEFRPDLAVVVLTGIADEHLGEQAVAAGAQDYLVKGQVDGYLLQRVVR